MLDIKAYSNLAGMMSQGKNVSAQAALNMSSKALSTYVTTQFIGEMMKNIEVNKLMGGGFAEEMYRSYLVEAIAEQVALKDGFGIERAFQKKLNDVRTPYKKSTKKENDHASIDLSL